MQRKIAVAALLLAALLAGAEGVRAQSAIMTLPRVSQHARVSQRIGITDITIDYSRPLVKGRKVFGTLEPYGKVWRAGANENSTIEFSDNVTVEGQALPKGVYGLHMIPGETSWAVIFSKNSTSWGSFSYDQAEDALRVTVKPRTIENVDALTYDFADPAATSVVVTMEWEKVAVPFKVEVNTPEVVQASLRNQLRARPQYEWQSWDEAATFLLDNKLSPEDALRYADRSIQLEDRFENEMLKSRALTALGKKDEALAARDKALSIGTQEQVQAYARGLQRQGKKEEALELFRINIKKNPNSWIAHNELARIAVAQGDYDTAVKEMKLAVSVAPEPIKGPLGDIVKRLENKVDINN